MRRGFGDVPAGAKRVVADTPARNGDDGVIVVRWFIPAGSGAGGLLHGDDRGFDSAPDLTERSRAFLTWDVATGRVSFTITHSTLIGGRQVPALKLRRFDNCADVRSTDFKSRDTNDVTLSGRRGIQLCGSLLNSVTNAADISSWSVDANLQITPNSADEDWSPSKPAGGYEFNMIGNGYPALEAYYYPRGEGRTHVLFKRRVDPEVVGSSIDEGGGLGALDTASWFRCVTPRRHQHASACFWDPDMENPKRQRDWYVTEW